MMTNLEKSVTLAALQLLACGVAASTFSCAEEKIDPPRARAGATRDGGAPVSAASTPPNLAPLRRLTALEYTNSVRDLFPGVVLPELTFPTETVANGFVNNASVQNATAVLIEAYQNAAAAVAAAIVASDKAPCKGVDPATCAPDAIRDLGGRLFRRPIAADEHKAFADFFAKSLASTNGSVAMRLTLAAMLQAPQFLYRVEVGRAAPGADKTSPRQLTDHETATRLSYFLWSSTPDDVLLSAAAKSELTTPEQIEGQARRLLADPRARASVVSFHEQWLDFQRLATSQKDPATFPSWNESLRAAMKQEGRLFVEKTIFDGEGTLEALLTSANTWVNPALAEFYGVAAPAPAAGLTGDFGPVSLDASRRGGLLTLPIILASQAHQLDGSPVLRGKFVLERFFCTTPPPPPPNINVSPPVAGGAAPKTNRQRYAVHTENAACAGCHQRMDSMGFTFESFDALGRYRTTDNGEPVDTTGTLSGSGAGDGPVKDALDLSQRLAASPTVQRCVTTEWFRYAYGRSELGSDDATLAQMAKTFGDGGGNVRELLIAIVKHPAFTTLPGSTP